MTNDLIQIQTLKSVDVFDGGVDDILKKIKEQVRSHVGDMSTKSGRESIASIAHKVARTKTTLDNMGKELMADARKTVDTVNAERKKLRDELDKLKDEVRAPLTQWEEAEKQRVFAHQTKIDSLNDGDLFEFPDPTLDMIAERINLIDDIYNRDWQEFSNRAQKAFNSTQEKLKSLYDAREKYDKDQAELQRLRKEKEERDRVEHERKIREEAAAKAKKEAEEKAERDRLDAERREKRAREEQQAKAKAERDKIEREKVEAEQRAQAEKKAREDAQAKAKQDAIDAENAKKQAQERAEREKREAVEAEKTRQREQLQAQKIEAQKREANKKHKASINNDILNVIQDIVEENKKPDIGKEIIKSIASGKVPHVKITY